MYAKGKRTEQKFYLLKFDEVGVGVRQFQNHNM